jgi:hypothetical protein
MYYHGDDKSGNPLFFHGNTIVNWGMFTMPRHVMFLHTLKNIVEILHAEYMRRPVLQITKWDQRWKYVLCGTNFVMTYTLRELALMNDTELVNAPPRICHRDFQQYYGKAKAIWTGKMPGHYMKAMNKDRSINILRQHALVDVQSIIAHLEGAAVTGETKDVYLVLNGIRRPFGSYDRFLAFNFTDSRIRYVRDTVMNAMPLGPPLTDEDNPSSTIVSSKPTTAIIQSSAAIMAAGPLEARLRGIRDEIDKTNYSCFGDNYSGTRDDFLNDVWKKYIGDDTTVMAYPMCLRTFQLGNTLGYYLNDLACSDLAGSHFIGISKHFDISGFDPNNPNKALKAPSGNPLHAAFFNGLADLVVHPSPLAPAAAKDIMRKQCHCLQYCWENNEAPWIQRIDYISSHLRHAIDAYINAVKVSAKTEDLKTSLNNETDLVYVKRSIIDLQQNEENLVPPTRINDVDLPLIPDVTIQYRCGDNIGFGKTRYGLLPYRAFTSRIPANARKIYIIADSPTRSMYHVYSGRCSLILAHLGKPKHFLLVTPAADMSLIMIGKYIHHAYPDAYVVIKRGGDLLLDYARLAYSTVTICSASTYCLWPALANQNTVHFPLTPLVARADTNATAPTFQTKTNSFHWITDVLLIKEFKSFRPWTKLIDTLEASS